MKAIKDSTWAFHRGKGWKKWISADGRSWVMRKNNMAHVVFYGVAGEYRGSLMMTPEQAMAKIESEVAA